MSRLLVVGVFFGLLVTNPQATQARPRAAKPAIARAPVADRIAYSAINVVNRQIVPLTSQLLALHDSVQSENRPATTDELHVAKLLGDAIQGKSIQLRQRVSRLSKRGTTPSLAWAHAYIKANEKVAVTTVGLMEAVRNNETFRQRKSKANGSASGASTANADQNAAPTSSGDSAQTRKASARPSGAVANFPRVTISDIAVTSMVGSPAVPLQTSAPATVLGTQLPSIPKPQ